MKEYGKITTEGQIMDMPNPYRVVVSNPSEEMKAQLADMFGWLEKVYTEQPEYNPETEYLTESWAEIEGKAVQTWTIHEIEEQIGG